MNKEYRCLWYTLPDRKQHATTYPTLEAAQAAMAAIIREAVKPQPFIDALRRKKDPDIRESAAFLEQFFEDLRFPEPDDGLSFHEEGIGSFRVDSDELYWCCPRGERPVMDACHKPELDQLPDAYLPEAYIFSFVYENPGKTRRCHGVQAEIWPTLRGTSANPLLIWKMLSDKPQNIDTIIRKITHYYGLRIERKAVGKHLTALRQLGFPVQHTAKGYFRSGTFQDPEPGIQFSSGAYPLMIWLVLDDTPKTQAEIIRAVQAKYGEKIDRKAVKRHLDLLEALQFPMEHGQNGYYNRTRQI